MQIRRLGTAQKGLNEFSWDVVLRKRPRPWYQRLIIPILIALLLPILSGSHRKIALPLGGDLTDSELWTQRLRFVINALHKTPTQETVATFRRLWKLALRQNKGGSEGIFFSLLYLESCWRKEGFSDLVQRKALPAKRFPRAHRFSLFLARIAE